MAAHPAGRAFPPLPPTIAARTVPQLLESARLEAPGTTALIGHSLLSAGQVELSYAELAERSRRLAAALEDRGVGRGDRVCILFANDGGVDAHVCYHAVHHLAAVNVPVNTRFVARELREVIGFAAPAAIVFAGEFAALVEEVVDRDAAPVLVEAAEKPRLGESLDALIGQASETRPAAELSEDDDADWVFTSGTTGSPKAIVLTHGSAVACGHEALGVWGLAPGSVMQCFAPFFTSTGCHTALLPSLVARATYVVEADPMAGHTVERLVTHRSTTLYVLTNLLAMIYRKAEAELIEALDAGHLKRLCYGGQVMPKAFHEKVHRMFAEERGIEIVSLYGLSEGGPCGLMVDPEDHAEAVRRIGAYGLPIGRRGFNDWVEYRVVADSGEEVPAGEPGEILFRAPSVMSRYAGDAEATEATLAGGWLHTGDLVLRDDAGFVFFVGRRKHMIRRGGLNISGAEVEGVLLGHPSVAEAVVVPRPNPVLGEDVHAVVVLAAGQQASEEEILEHCRAELAAFKVPYSLAFVSELPRNANDRVVRAELPPEALPWLAETTEETA